MIKSDPLTTKYYFSAASQTKQNKQIKGVSL